MFYDYKINSIQNKNAPIVLRYKYVKLHFKDGYEKNKMNNFLINVLSLFHLR